MESISVSTWDEFVALSAELDGWAFRGQQDASWALLSSLSRYLASFIPDKSSWRLREQRAIRLFRRKAHNYLPDPAVLDNDLRCLALMQHHGAPAWCRTAIRLPLRCLSFRWPTARLSVIGACAVSLPRAADTPAPVLTRQLVVS